MTHGLVLNQEPQEPAMQALKNQAAEPNQCGRIAICKQSSLLCIFIPQLVEISHQRCTLCIACDAHMNTLCSQRLMLAWGGGGCLFVWFLTMQICLDKSDKTCKPYTGFLCRSALLRQASQMKEAGPLIHFLCKFLFNHSKWR